jgi:signal transduction histidine kinase
VASGSRQPACRCPAGVIERSWSGWSRISWRTPYNHPGGFVRVDLSKSAQRAVLRVSNSGPRVPAAAVPRLFEPFFRVDESRSRDSGGAGLGLSIVAAVAAAHGGTAAAAAREGGGLVVTVTLPADTSTPLAAAG